MSSIGRPSNTLNLDLNTPTITAVTGLETQVGVIQNEALSTKAYFESLIG